MANLDYPPMGSLVKIDYSTLIHTICPHQGSINVVVTDDTYGVIVSYDPQYDQSVEVMIGSRHYAIKSYPDVVPAYWPFQVVSELPLENC